MAYCEVCGAPLPHSGYTIQRWCGKPKPCRKIGRAREREEARAHVKKRIAGGKLIVPPTAENLRRAELGAAIDHFARKGPR